MNRSTCLGVAVSLLVFGVAHGQGGGGGADADADAADGDDSAEQAPVETTTTDAEAKPLVAKATPATDDASEHVARGLADFTTTKSPFSWEPFGFLRMQYRIVQNDPNVEYVGRADGFEMQNARFGVRGSYDKRVRYVLSVDGAVDERLEQNTPEGRLRVGLRDAYTDVLTSGKLFVRAGFFQTWADPQRLVADVTREFVDRPIESRGVRSTEGHFAPGLPPGRSIGAALRLEPEAANQVGFEVAVQNGADEFSSNNDNDLPAVSVGAMYRLADDGFIVAGARYNPRTEGGLPFRQDETDLQGSLGVQINMSAVRVAGGAIVQKTFFGSTGGPDEDAFGAHAQLTFRIPAGAPVWVGYRFGILDSSSLILSDRVMEHTAGGYVGVPQLRMRLQLQVTHVVEQAARDLSNSRIQLAAEVAL